MQGYGALPLPTEQPQLADAMEQVCHPLENWEPNKPALAILVTLLDLLQVLHNDLSYSCDVTVLSNSFADQHLHPCAQNQHPCSSVPLTVTAGLQKGFPL